MDEKLKKEMQEEILKLISLPITHKNELIDIMQNFDKTLEKVSRLPKNLQDEAARVFLALLIKYNILNFDNKYQ